jgi:hypothetical protein
MFSSRANLQKGEMIMICEKHNIFFPTKRCPACIEERAKEIRESIILESEIRQLEREINEPIVVIG